MSSITKNGEIESAFAPYVGFGVLMTSKLGTNEIYYSFSPLKALKSWSTMKWYPSILQVQKADEPKVLSKAFLFYFGFRYAIL